MYRIGGAEAFASEVASTARVWQSTGRLSENTVSGEPAALDTYGDEDGKFGSDALHSWALAAIDADAVRMPLPNDRPESESAL